ncbi:hypothetical protein BDP27DRAFT_1365572 [Rhodocollybia butyracea]|uniref:Uncharacterized protein n=1 Tax=Rhodocollybia butyracea TaxID=206335 RepID=A0A9P5PNJ3_9AGAR|nr:hypothetical protein BDP27DRAFT_1365572 [Rhodocollybia butyracea]
MPVEKEKQSKKANQAPHTIPQLKQQMATSHSGPLGEGPYFYNNHPFPNMLPNGQPGVRWGNDDVECLVGPNYLDDQQPAKPDLQYPVRNLQYPYPVQNLQYPVRNLQYPVRNLQYPATSNRPKATRMHNIVSILRDCTGPVRNCTEPTHDRQPETGELTSFLRNSNKGLKLKDEHEPEELDAHCVFQIQCSD